MPHGNKTVLIITDKKTKKLECWTILTTVSIIVKVPYPTLSRHLLKKGFYENDFFKVERLNVNR